MSKSPSPNLRLVDRLERRLLIGRSEARTDVAKPEAESGQAAGKYHRIQSNVSERASGFTFLVPILSGLPPSFLTPAPPRLRRVSWVIGWKQASEKRDWRSNSRLA